jgi:macrolide-specific efflux system membrane fusion protein
MQEKKGALLLPLSAVQSRNGKTVVLQKKGSTQAAMFYSPVNIGLQDESNIEIVTGLTDSSVVLLPDTSFVLPKNSTGSNPFTPQRSRTKK